MERGLIVSKAIPRIHQTAFATPKYHSENSGKVRSAYPFAVDGKTIVGTYASIPFPSHVQGTNDNSYAYTINGGALHGSLHAGNGGGMYAYTAKYADVDIGTTAKPGPAVTNPHIPYFNIHFHRESWSTTSTNMYIAFDHDAYEELVTARTMYRSSLSSSSSSNDDSDGSSACAHSDAKRARHE